MRIYLVGGAIRDQLLGLPVKERDWVVVGASPDQMIKKGYKPVGKDFPVFLHPKTRDEYALARTERKTKKGYTGFEFYTAPDVTLEDDLKRRDLTINAMAQTTDGEIIDPYGGQKDLQAKLLRHVSDAFAEDPVRILRVARFAARYAHLGFTIADDTILLMRKMVDNSEVNALVAERVWQEMEKALQEPAPQVFFTSLRTCGALAKILPELDRLFGVPAKPEFHPEIDTGIHTMLVLEQAAALSPEPITRFAALMHDLGKGVTPEDILPSHIGHEAAGIPIIKSLSQRLRIPKNYRDLAILTAKYHTHCHDVMELTPKKLLGTLNHLDAFRRPKRFQQFLLACEADVRGRKGFENEPFPERDYFYKAYEIANQITPRSFSYEELTGIEIAEKLRLLRLAALKDFIRRQQSSR